MPMKMIVYIFLLLGINSAFAAPAIVFPEDHAQHVTAATESWVFTGEIETEEGEKYAYIYRIKRKNNTLYVFANIINLSVANKKAVFTYKDHITYTNDHTDKQSIQWKVGNAFMKYNIIGDSWFFGITDDQNSFNFRVKGVRNYVLNGDKGYLSAFQASYSAQSMSINGHLTLDGKSAFVTGKNSWFEHYWGTASSGHKASKYALITCRFNDNTGLMLYEWFGEKDIWPVRLKTGTYQNALDEKMLLSDFSLAKSVKTQQWRISIPALKINISGLSDTLPESEYNVIHVNNNKEGYCFVNEKGY